MTDQLTPNAVALQLAQLARDLDHLVTEIDTAEKAAVNAREDFTMTHARAFLAAAGSMDIRRYVAVEATHAERIAAELAEQHVKAIRRQIESVRLRVEVGRTLAATLRTEMTNLGGHGA